jgi:hypothetical protein
MYAYYFSVYTSIYLCCSFWYRFESSLLIKGSLVCFTLELYNLSISFRNWTNIYNGSINLKCFNNVKATEEHFVYFRTNPFTEWTIFFEKYSHSMYRPELYLQSLDNVWQVLWSFYIYLVFYFVFSCSSLFYISPNLAKLNFFQLEGYGEGHKDTTGKFWVGSVNLFNVSDQMSGKPSRKLTFVFFVSFNIIINPFWSCLLLYR